MVSSVEDNQIQKQKYDDTVDGDDELKRAQRVIDVNGNSFQDDSHEQKIEQPNKGKREYVFETMLV